MKFNRDQIIKALECLSLGSIFCDPKCPYYSDRCCQVALSRDAIALIKELTEENDKFRYERRKLIEARDTFEEYAYKMQLYIEYEKHKEEAGYEPSAARYAAEMEMWRIVALEKKRLEEEIDLLKTEAHDVKADTVRKMQESLCEGRVANDPVVIATNVVAKEMLEENNV